MRWKGCACKRRWRTGNGIQLLSLNEVSDGFLGLIIIMTKIHSEPITKEELEGYGEAVSLVFSLVQWKLICTQRHPLP